MSLYTSPTTSNEDVLSASKQPSTYIKISSLRPLGVSPQDLESMSRKKTCRVRHDLLNERLTDREGLMKAAGTSLSQRTATVWAEKSQNIRK
jgi:hypothetical protein